MKTSQTGFESNEHTGSTKDRETQTTVVWACKVNG